MTDGTIGPALATAERVAASLRASLDELRPVMPLAGGQIDRLDRRRHTEVLAFLKAFEQLQDVMSRRLMRAVLQAGGEDVAAMTARDAFYRLESLGALADGDRFSEITALRHRLAHEYPMDDAKRAQRVNDAWAFAPALLEELDTLAAYARRMNGGRR